MYEALVIIGIGVAAVLVNGLWAFVWWLRRVLG